MAAKSHDDHETHHRRSVRLRDYDYRQAGAYFVTICAHDRLCIFGEAEGSRVVLNDYGIVVQEEWLRTEAQRPHVRLDAFVVMPNHVHGIIVLQADDQEGTARRAPTGATARFGEALAGSLATVVGAFKSAASRRINQMRGTPGMPVWQRNYYEHVIRSEKELNRIRQYIADNPTRWALDPENPSQGSGLCSEIPTTGQR